jgi:hypothetical protein
MSHVTLYLILLSVFLGACAGSPARTMGSDSRDVADGHMATYTNQEMCDKKTYWTYSACLARKDYSYGDYCQKMQTAYQLNWSERSLPEDYCANSFQYEEAWAAQSKIEQDWVSEIYNIDLLKVTTLSRKDATYCASGGVHKIIVEGQISPDSSYAMSRLLERM